MTIQDLDEMAKGLGEVRTILLTVQAHHVELTHALEEMYKYACHHPRCVRGEAENHWCSCGLSAALELTRKALGKPDFS